MANHELTSMRDALPTSLSEAVHQAPEHIQTRQQAKGIMQAILPTKDQKLVIFNHLHSVGADNHVLGENKELNRQVMQKWFQTLVVNNSRFPSDLNIEFVLSEFSESILQQKVKLKGFNLNAHMQAFHDWMENYETELRKKHWMKLHPERRRRELPASATVSEEEQQISDSQRAKNLRDMYGDNMPAPIKKLYEKLTTPTKE